MGPFFNNIDKANDEGGFIDPTKNTDEPRDGELTCALIATFPLERQKKLCRKPRTAYYCRGLCDPECPDSVVDPTPNSRDIVDLFRISTETHLSDRSWDWSFLLIKSDRYRWIKKKRKIRVFVGKLYS